MTAIDNPALTPADIATLERKLRNLPEEMRADIIAKVNAWTPDQGPFDLNDDEGESGPRQK